MELIEEVEKTRRGLYGGVIGYLDFAGNADFAIAIRTALMRNGTAYVQAAAGSGRLQRPYEHTEATNKARAVLRAIAAAETLTAPTPAAMAKPERRKPTVLTAQLLLVIAAGGLWRRRGCRGSSCARSTGSAHPGPPPFPGRRGRRRWFRWRCCCWPSRSPRWRCGVAVAAAGHAGRGREPGQRLPGHWLVGASGRRGTRADLAHVPVFTLVGSERRYWGAAITLVATACMVAGAVLLMRSATGPATTKYATRPHADRGPRGRRHDLGARDVGCARRRP
ncbi:chorismate binding enzyme family protein [Mycobacterium xenopi 4042]|uniref:Anthranilate synthase component 1 n=1 Tax=Mycobacterium xenopi 4042 TaxID=1299334 RepID=X7YQH3_MYCXE|nr:chorismate binding enzyme family protein [Mycobacterium xenopi 4042]